MKQNTIILQKGYGRFTRQYFNLFTTGDTIFGSDVNTEEIKRWSIEEKEEALAELNKYKSIYTVGNICEVTEYALEFCTCDDDGKFIEGSDYILA